MKRLAAGKRVLFFAITLMVAVALAAPALAQQAPIKWKAQTLWNAQERPQKTFEEFCKRVKVLTNGRLEIEPYPAGAIVPTNETLTALQGNVLQAIHVWPGYASGRNPAFAALCDFIFAYESPWELDAFMHYRGGLELLRELYKPFGAYTVGVMVWGLESWPSKKPIRNMDDFKGLKIREPQGMEAEFMAKAGASVVVLPGTEIFSAMDKGVIDATNWATASINDQTGFHQVAPYFSYPGFHSMPVGDFTVRQQEWDKLPEDIKADPDQRLPRVGLGHHREGRHGRCQAGFRGQGQGLYPHCLGARGPSQGQKARSGDLAGMEGQERADQARHRAAGSLAAGARPHPVT